MKQKLNQSTDNQNKNNIIKKAREEDRRAREED
jgi:hypothetical protein